MARIYNDHLTGEIRESAIQTAYFENQFNKLNTMYEMVCMQERQMINDAEYKVFSESGTYDDYEFYLEEVEKETGEQKQGIISKILETIKNLIMSIINGIKNIFSKNTDTEIEVDSKDWNAVKSAKEGVTSIKSGFSKILTGDIKGGIAEIPTGVKVLTGVTASIGAAAAATSKIKVKRSDVEGEVSLLTSCLTDIKNGIDTIANKFKNNNLLKSAIDNINSAVKAIEGLVNRILSFVKDKASNVADTVKGNNDNGSTVDPEIERRQKAAKNGVQIINNGDYEYRIDKTSSKVTLFDKKNNKESDIDINTTKVPGSVITAVKKAKSMSAMNNQQNTKQTAGGQYRSISSQMTDGQQIKVFVNEKNGKIRIKNNKDGSGSEEISKPDLMSLLGNDNYKKFEKAYKNVLNNAKTNESVDGHLNFVEAFTEAGFDVYREDEDTIYIEFGIDNNYIENTDESIFGYNLEDAMYLQESANFEKELDELAELFKTL